MYRCLVAHRRGLRLGHWFIIGPIWLRLPSSTNSGTSAFRWKIFDRPQKWRRAPSEYQRSNPIFHQRQRMHNCYTCYPSGDSHDVEEFDFQEGRTGSNTPHSSIQSNQSASQETQEALVILPCGKLRDPVGVDIGLDSSPPMRWSYSPTNGLQMYFGPVAYKPSDELNEGSATSSHFHDRTDAPNT